MPLVAGRSCGGAAGLVTLRPVSARCQGIQLTGPMLYLVQVCLCCVAVAGTGAADAGRGTADVETGTAVAGTGATAAAAGGPDVAIVAAPPFHAALQPWIEWRKSQGHGVALIDPAHDPAAVRDALRRLAQAGALKYVLLVGDAWPGERMLARPEGVPTYHAPARVNVSWGSEPEIATDNWYADLDEDLLPDLAVGRLPVHSAAELEAIVGRIVRYEQADLQGEWRRRINFVAGLGGFGRLADLAIEAAARSIIGRRVPAPYVTTMTHASWQSPYCPDPARFHETVCRRIDEGCLFWVYIGHGQRREVDRFYTPQGAYAILHADDVVKLRADSHPPIAVLLACYTGAYDGEEDCLAESLLRAPGGPIAVLAGSRVTMPYGMSVLGLELVSAAFEAGSSTLGELMVRAKRNTMLAERSDPQSQAIDAVARALAPPGHDLLAERREHLLLFNLLGDPLLRLRWPRNVEVSADAKVAAGGRIRVRGRSSVRGKALVELVVRRDRLHFKPPLRREYDESPASRAEYERVYALANAGCLCRRDLPVDEGEFELQLDVPATARGACHVRVYIEGRAADGSAACALGSADVFVERTSPAGAPPYAAKAGGP